MKRIGLLGGTSWPSTALYYSAINRMVAERLGGHHSADMILRSIDYHAIKSNYNGGWDRIPELLEREIRFMLTLPCDCLILCNNTLHKAFDLLRDRLALPIPFFHAVELTARYAQEQELTRLLLLGTRFTMEDGFFRDGLTGKGLEVNIPDAREREDIQAIQLRLAAGENHAEFSVYFDHLLAKYAHLDAAVLACTELPLAIPARGGTLRIVDPAWLQAKAAVDFALAERPFFPAPASKVCCD
jgi:aspartate racemase